MKTLEFHTVEDTYLRYANWFSRSLDGLLDNDEFYEDDRFLQFLGELSVLCILLESYDYPKGSTSGAMNDHLEKLIEYYLRAYPWKTDPKLYRLSCLLSNATQSDKSRSLLQLDYLRDTAISQFFSKERTPWEILTLKYSESPTELCNSNLLPSEVNLVSTSLLNSSCSPHLLTREGLYAITHIVLFSTRFGICDISSVVSDPAVLKERLFEILEYTLLADEADISAEFILSILALGVSWDEVATQFRETNAKFEFPALFEDQEAVQAEPQRFWDKYHTCLVVLMVCVLGNKSYDNN
ncbi:DUF6895 family protein [Parasulfitobacter algicola]|uniref:DUF6895 domain-containing protein n=1 Tax=Parasulfitobacter algicola TaxID=2614809 RepID=A0ABX2IK71_9RHOB|nr:hypothetical protein [Sulfitobacter algicola]NSX53282.1 hypothetical protein [Sulfitobacter algicola]